MALSRRRGIAVKPLANPKTGLLLCPLEASEIEAWARLVGADLRPYEAEWLLAIDDAYLAVARRGELGADKSRVPITDSASLSALLPTKRKVKAKRKRP